ncbi:MAG: flavodoxin family protein [Treponema sp.]
MNILILNGSPRANGKISQILHYIEKEACGNGHSVTFIDAHSLSFLSCKGCMACRSKTQCILPADDAHKIADLIQKCDAIVVGSPVYWGNISGELKRLFDRLVGVMMGESKMGLPLPLHKGKNAVIVTACTTPFPFNVLAEQTTKAVKALKEILSYSGFKIKAKIILPGTKGMKELPPKIEKKSRRAAKRIFPC